MEEVTPITVSDVSRLAPEEIYEKPDNLPVGDTEKEKEERKRERRKKKKEKKKSNLQKEKIQRDRETEKALTTPNNKGKEREIKDIKKGSVDKAVKQIKEAGNVKFVSGTDNTNYSRSSTLFKQLQDGAKKEISDYKLGKNTKQAAGSASSESVVEKKNIANGYKL